MSISERNGIVASADQEISRGVRFAFGRNWAQYQRVIDEERISDAIRSLRDMLELETLEGCSFLDIGSGSGLFSLAASRLGAKVWSFDFDPVSVECTRVLKQRFGAEGAEWTIEQGSVLDEEYMANLGSFDIVYSWGVLHHTGNMSKALKNAQDRVKPGGLFFVALYNDQGYASRYWKSVKRLYCSSRAFRPLIIFAHAFYPLFPTFLMRLIRSAKEPRGMSLTSDFIDWLGGYPFEVSKPGDIVHRHRERGFMLRRLNTVGGKMGCNEFVFQSQEREVL